MGRLWPAVGTGHGVLAPARPGPRHGGGFRGRRRGTGLGWFPEEGALRSRTATLFWKARSARCLRAAAGVCFPRPRRG